MEEFSPVDHFYKFLHYWWILLAAAIVGGMIGFFYSRAHKPIYEAIATFSVNIDLNKVPQPPLELYDEDIALSNTQAVLLSPEVTKAVLSKAAELGYPMDNTQLINSSSIERRNAFWLLRFRSTDPGFAKTLVNFWATNGYQGMLDWQNNGTVPPYVVFSAPELSGTPTDPVNYGTNKLVLMGSLIGWLVALIGIELVSSRTPASNES